jgi:Tol biopolymer transport system component
MWSKQVRSLVTGVAALGILGSIVWLNQPIRLPHANALAVPALAPAVDPAGTPVTPRVVIETAEGKPAVNAAAFKNQGDLAFVWRDLLYRLEGKSGDVKQLTDSGKASRPTWSHDGQWLAFIKVTDAQAGSGALWLVRRDGTEAHQVQGLPGPVGPEDFLWSPTANSLAVRSEGLWLAPVDGGLRPLDPAPGLLAFAWSPDGKQLAYNITLPSAEPINRSDALFTIAVDGGKPVQQLTAPQMGVQVAAWWPDGKGVLFWQMPLHSGSLAADGMEIMSLELGHAQAKPLTSSLAHREWLAFTPNGDLLVNAGNGRTVWTNKHLETCDIKAGICQPLAHPQGIVSLDPAPSPDGKRVALVAAKELAPDVAGFKPEQLKEWVATRTLWVVNSDGSDAHALPAAGTGIYQPMWSKDGSQILYVRDNALWLIGAKGGEPQRVVGPFPGDPDLFGFYGYVSFSNTVAWFQP